ncbi:FeoA family protein [Lederbergia citrea]|uniref:Ferrous iron transport protein A n=1 Tax=Lederbergia citrea TaxID=2833581 RepID=A0A942UTN2_9BACI|nr:FeoA family protein [Lederbergia citrea]MBS4177754.1 ferrous iron transport protein A [Lederbergia citrea]MBS4223729.1 ferrous iron transport protein A [Lederbergia citrea]
MVLSDIHAGEKVRITNTDWINELVQRRLLDLGIMEGSVLKIKRILPLGGPITIEAKGQLIGIRRCEAKKIRVESV